MNKIEITNDATKQVLTSNNRDTVNTVEMPTPFAKIKIVINSEDLHVKDEIIEWLFKKCGITTQKDKARFHDKCEKIKQLIKKGKLKYGH